MNRRNFMAAALGYLGCTTLKAEGSEDKPLVLLPKLAVTQGENVTRDGFTPGIFMLAQDETETYLPLGEEVEVEVLAYRERVVTYGLAGESLEVFSCYDPTDPRFVEIKSKTSGKSARCLHRDEQGRICVWQIESVIRVAGHEARIGHSGRAGMFFVANTPIGGKAKYDIKDTGFGRYFRRLVSINGESVAGRV